jgi:uncharacterized cupin superfamily protein
MPKLDLDTIPQTNATGYPPPYAEPMAKRHYRRLAPVNRGDRPCIFIAVGKPAKSDCHYPDVDLHLDGASGRFTRKDGTA